MGSVNFLLGAEICSSQTRSANNQTQTMKAVPSQASSATYHQFPSRSPLARVKKRLDETLNCLEYSAQQEVSIDLISTRHSRTRPGVLSHEDREQPKSELN